MGSDLLIQSFLVQKHFAQDAPAGESFFARRRAEAEKAEKAEKEEAEARRAARSYHPDDDEDDGPRTRGKAEKKPEPLALSFKLGYAYARPTPAVATESLTSHGIVGGLAWEALPNVEIAATLGADLIPDQDYQHGRLQLRLEYLHSFRASAPKPGGRVQGQARRPLQEDDGKDAAAFYLKRSEFFNDPNSFGGMGGGGERDARTRKRLLASHPHLRVALVVQADQHTLGEGANASLSQYAAGPDVSLRCTRQLSLRASAMINGYSGLVKTFARPLAASGSGVERLMFSAAETSAWAPDFLAFPDLVFEQRVTYAFSPRWIGELGFNQVYYVTEGTSEAFSANPAIHIVLDESWMAGVGSHLVTTRNGAAAFGMLNISYLF